MTTATSADSTGTRTPIHLWVVGSIALLWNAFGAFDYLMTNFRVESYMSRFTPEQLAYFYSFPAWATAFWAIGVWSAVAGSIALLLRSRFAIHLFALSLIGLIGTTIYTNVVTDAGAVMEGVGYMIFSLIIAMVLIGLLVYSVMMRRRHVLR